MLNATETELANRLVERLPDRRLSRARQLARSRFSPSLAYGRHFGPPYAATKQAAVMVLLERDHPQCPGWSIPLTVRPDYLADHPGQISLPGGRLEGNETHQQAAEREFCEELGVQEFTARVLGYLQPIYVYRSDYYVRPFVSISEKATEYQPCEFEVAEILHLPLGLLLDKSQHGQLRFARGRAAWQAPTITIAGRCLWGATAIILAELAELLPP